MTNIKLKSKANFFNKIVNCLRTPSLAMIYTWMIWLLMYVLSPFYYTTPVNFSTAIAIVVSITAFVIGDVLSGSVLEKKSSSLSTFKQNTFNFEQISSPKLDRLIRNCAIIGLIGAGAIVFIKVVISGLDFSGGVSGARLQRANDVLKGNAESSSVLLYPALLAFPFGTAAFLSGLLNPNILSKEALTWSRIALIAPIAVTVVSGGRGGILHVLLMAFSGIALGIYSNRATNKPLPNLSIGKFPIIIFAAFVVYSVYIFEDRRDVTGANNFLASIDSWRNNYGIYPADWLLNLVEHGILEGNWLLNIMQSYYYFTHGPSMFAKIFENSSMSIGPYYGQYQIGLLPALIDKFLPNLSLSEKMFTETVQVGVAGVFPSAWGMIYFDFGFLGIIIEPFILGWLARIVYHKAIYEQIGGTDLIFCFVLASILLSPMIAPFGFSDSSFTAIAMFYVSRLINSIQRNEEKIAAK